MMRKVIRNVRQFSLSFSSVFFKKIVPYQASPIPFAFFRIGIALIGLAQIALISPYIKQFYGNYGLIQWTILETSGDKFAFSIGQLGFLMYQGMRVSADTTLYIVFATYVLFLIGLLVGWKKNLVAIGAWFTHLLIYNSGYLAMYGVDSLIHTCLFYCMFMPVSEVYSLDQYFGKKKGKPSFYTTVSLRILQCHLCIIYLNTGFAKIQGIQWRNGEAIWKALMMPRFAVLDFSWLSHFPYLAVIVCISVVLIETGYAIMIWARFSRKFWLTAIILLHTAIALLMGLTLFSAVMIWMNLCAFGFTVYPIEAWLNRLQLTKIFSKKKPFPPNSSPAQPS